MSDLTDPLDVQHVMDVVPRAEFDELAAEVARLQQRGDDWQKLHDEMRKNLISSNREVARLRAALDAHDCKPSPYCRDLHGKWLCETCGSAADPETP